MNRKLIILARIRGIQNPPEEYYFEEFEETVHERNKRHERLIKLQHINSRLNLLWETYVAHDFYKRVQFAIQPCVSIADKVRQLEDMAPSHVLLQIRPLIAAKHLRLSRRGNKTRSSNDEEPSNSSLEEGQTSGMGAQGYYRPRKRGGFPTHS